MTEMVACVVLNSVKYECDNQWKPGKYKVESQGRYGNYIPIELWIYHAIYEGGNFNKSTPLID